MGEGRPPVVGTWTTAVGPVGAARSADQRPTVAENRGVKKRGCAVSVRSHLMFMVPPTKNNEKTVLIVEILANNFLCGMGGKAWNK